MHLNNKVKVGEYMKVLVVMDSFKGSICSKDACFAVKTGFEMSDASFVLECIPMADGGEGTIESFVTAMNGEAVECDATGLFSEPIKGYYGVLNDKTAVIETAVASGITLVPKEKLNPLKATTYGTGEIIRKVLEQGYTNIIIGLGGSGTNDGGMGALQALGVRFFDKEDNLLGIGGEMLTKVARIDCSQIHQRVENAHFTLATDVKNGFCGKDGASYIFAPQKGADEEMVKLLDLGLNNFAKVIKEFNGKDVMVQEGSGAAGGLCGGLWAFTHSTIKSGAEILSEITELDKKILNADIVITGEGKTDDQTAYGKLPSVIAGIANGKVPVIVLSGSVDVRTQKLYEQGVCSILSIMDSPMTLEKAMSDTDRLLKQAGFNLGRLIKTIKGAST